MADLIKLDLGCGAGVLVNRSLMINYKLFQYQ